jgi:cytochrome c553
LSVPGSNIHFTEADIRNWSVTSDWFPKEHSNLPPVLAASHSPKNAACGYCHLPDGTGRPENAKLAGLPAAYIIAQVKAFQARERRAAKPNWAATGFMVEFTTDLATAEIAAAADYFSHQTVRSLVRVVERVHVPRHVVACFIFVPSPGRAVPLGLNIVEMPTDVERFERRDPHTSYVAYVPVGSIARGRILANAGGGGRTQPCATCHGPDLKGGSNLPGPPLTGRFPSYLFRPLYGFQSGARDGDAAQPMLSVAARLTQGDMIDLAAYAASLKP